MEHRSKSVAAILAFMLLVTPAVALASCSQVMPAMEGGNDAGMMGMIMPPVSGASSRGSFANCCVKFLAEITPSFSTIEASAILVSPAHTPHFWRPLMPLIPVRTFRVSSSPDQALLCVFLI
jgi:hypothetical protein